MAIASPPRPPSQDELEALIREARERQRRRRLLAAAALAGVVAIGLSVWAALPGGARARHAAKGRLPVGAALPPCRTGELRISLPLAYAATGHEGGYLRFLNASQQRCLLSGWPKVRVVRADRTTIPLERQTAAEMWVPLIWPHARKVPRFILRPGQSGIAEIQDTDVPMNGRKACATARFLRVAAPGDGGYVTISARLPKEATYLPLCGPPGISPLVPLVALPN